MALTPDQTEIFKKHMETRWKQVHCPICREIDWQVDGLVAPMFWKDLPTPTLGSEAFPLIVLFCNNCFYVNHFMWLPIKKAAQKGG